MISYYTLRDHFDAPLYEQSKAQTDMVVFRVLDNTLGVVPNKSLGSQHNMSQLEAALALESTLKKEIG